MCFQYWMAAGGFYRWMGLGATELIPSTCLILESDALPLSVVHSIIPVAGKVLAETLQLSVPSPGLALHLHISSLIHTLLHLKPFFSYCT